jgi:transposase InsO family protein
VLLSLRATRNTPGVGAGTRERHCDTAATKTRTQLELAIVEYVGWFNDQRLHSSLNDSPPAEHEFRYAAARR